MIKPNINVHLPPLAKNAMAIIVITGLAVSAFFVIKHFEEKKLKKRAFKS